MTEDMRGKRFYVVREGDTGLIEGNVYVCINSQWRGRSGGPQSVFVDEEGGGGPLSYYLKRQWVEEGLVVEVEAHTPTPKTLNQLCEEVHEANVEAGWWNCQKTGEDMRDNVYFQATKLLLIHAEVSEAAEGLRKGNPDDKLPQYSNEAVELADVFIRLLDYCGAKGYDMDEIINAKMAFNSTRRDHKVENRKKVGGKLF